MATKRSFANILEVARQQQQLNQPKPPSNKGKTPSPAITRTEEGVNVSDRQPIPAPKTSKRFGKSSNPDFTQALAYVRKATYQNVKKALIDESDLDFSELVESLLAGWLKNRLHP